MKSTSNFTEGIFRYRKREGVEYAESQLFDGIRGVAHAFITRRCTVNGVDLPRFTFSSREGDSPEIVAESWRRLSEAFEIPADRFISLRQVHGTKIIVPEDVGRKGNPPVFQGDGLATALRGVALSIRTADCVPLLLFDPRRCVVAAIHAGWRGTAAGIAKASVDLIVSRFGSDPGDLMALLGPAVGPCCYEVDGPVIDAFKNHERLTDIMIDGCDGKARLDLEGANAVQLVGAGLDPARIDRAGICTACTTTHFFSHRKEGKKTGRQLNFIMLY
ncbi:MAG: peptidoglycan editing factor PgeF [Deltaproteobacteria bacterium]|nr:peptidoglycan editing factor PgeF [Deltaproteobacteria bacterium]